MKAVGACVSRATVSRRAAASGRKGVRTMAQSQDDLKRKSAESAVEYIKSGMRIGLGTGSTAAFAVQLVGELVQSGDLKDIVAIPTSIKTQEQAECALLPVAHPGALGIPLTTLDEVSELDVAIDGADEVDKDLNLVKGRGGALLREKMVENAAKTFIVIVDEGKHVDQLGGSKDAMPVEVTPFCWRYNLSKIQNMPQVAGCTPKRREENGEPYVTDNNNYIIDLYFDTKFIEDAHAAGNALQNVVGVVEHGLFLDMANVCITGGANGVTVKERGQ